ncbi:MAG: FtsX-like permease family protein [Raoultibacter sp.]|jgi:putative ABC transport system permease protein
MWKLYYRMTRKDIARSKLVSITTLLFVTVASMLVALAAILGVNLTGSIGTMMEKAQTPHFMQMHSGELDEAALDDFARSQPVTKYQVLEFLNIDNAEIVIDGESMIGSVQDNGFSMQSGSFDYLMSLDNEIIHPTDGEVYIPIAYMKDGTAEIGDTMTVCDQSFTVGGFLRDSQMNASLASSKRFLISENDYVALRELGNVEYLIEFRVSDTSLISVVENAYIAAGLPANGPALTWQHFQLMNALSDGLMIAVILLVSLLVVAIALFCIRFTLLAKIEDEYQEIGVMKAVGLRLSDIRGVYLTKYAVMAAVGCALGLALSFLLQEPMMEGIRLNMGESGQDGLAAAFGLGGVVLIFLAIGLYVVRILRRFKSISAADALRFGMAQEKPAGAKRMVLSKNRLLNTNMFMGMKDVFARKKLYVIMLASLILSGFIMIVPVNLANTIASSEFTQHMGIGDYDIRVDIQQTDNIEDKTMDIEAALLSDSRIDAVSTLTTKTFTVRSADGTSESMKVELGDHSIFPIFYEQGQAPIAKNEIALSSLLADDLEKAVGDTVTLVINGQEEALIICGIYSDVTNGGKTAKATFTDDSADVMWALLGVTVFDAAQTPSIVSDYASNFPYAKISDVSEYVKQTLGSTSSALNTASYAAAAVAIIIAALITLLFIKMLIVKDRYSIAVMKALGFTNKDISLQYISRAVMVFIISIVLSMILSATLGESVAGMLLSSMSITSFTFVTNPVISYFLCPLALLCAVLIATFAGTAQAGRVNIAESVKE